MTVDSSRTRSCGNHPDHVDGRQRVDDRQARGVRAAGGRTGCAGHLLPGAVPRPLLRHQRGREVLRLRRAGRRPHRRSASPKLAAELNMVIVLPIYEEEQPGVLLQHRRGDRRRRHHPRQVPQAPHPAPRRSSGRSSTSAPATLGYPVFDTAVGQVGVYICYDRHFPEGWRVLGLNGARDRVQPLATKPGLSNRLWELEQPAAAAANQYYVGRAQPHRQRRQRVRRARRHVLRQLLLRRPARQLRRRRRLDRHRGDGRVRDLDMGLIREVRNNWQFYRDRRPDSYDPIVAP